MAAGPGASQDKPPQNQPAKDTPAKDASGKDASAKSAAGKTEEDGKWLDADGNPTYNISADGKVDWYTYSGFRRYHSECHVCHGPEGEGSTYAPGLINSLKTITYPEFQEVVASGRTVTRPDKTSVMPALGDNVNVMCYLDDIYVYLKARADGALPRGQRPQRGVEKPETAIQNEKSCLGL
ncbi:c-type cytochrome, methanol metabolism-related [Azorhizobium oxalatiphilum]|nr:c-type cytochrome, methanol metabolism-related [Azorhizobium oxalatiphilum]